MFYVWGLLHIGDTSPPKQCFQKGMNGFGHTSFETKNGFVQHEEFLKTMSPGIHRGSRCSLQRTVRDGPAHVGDPTSSPSQKERSPSKQSPKLNGLRLASSLNCLGIEEV